MTRLLFVLICAIGAALRFYNLGIVPNSLDWDEVSMQYNAYSLLLHGKDEYGNTWPLSIRSFNDYKPPLYTYLAIPSIAIFGNNEFAIRFSSAFIGSLTIPFVFLLTRQYISKTTIPYAKYLPFASMAVFALSPWSIQFSRAAFEANIAVFFVTAGMYMFCKYLSTSATLWMYAAAVFLATAMYAYHAPRLIVPLLAIAMFIRYKLWKKEYRKTVTISACIALIIIAPLAIVLIRGNAASRFSSVSIFNPSQSMHRTLEYAHEDEKEGKWQTILHNRRILYIQQFIKGYLDHFYPAAMFLTGDPVGRHHAPDVGMFYLIELPFMIRGIIVLIQIKFRYKFLYFFWAIIAPIPAAIATGTPHAIRSILFLPIPQIAIAAGICMIVHDVGQIKATISEKAKYIKTAIAVIAALYIINITYYLHQYYTFTDIEYAPEWQYGYKELMSYLKQIEHKYEKIIITTAWDQPYIYVLHYHNYDPRQWINNGEFNKGFDKYEFRTIEFEKDRRLKNTLLIGSFLEIPQGEPGTIKVIPFPDKKRDVFRIYETTIHN